MIFNFRISMIVFAVFIIAHKTNSDAIAFKQFLLDMSSIVSLLTVHRGCQLLFDVYF